MSREIKFKAKVVKEIEVSSEGSIPVGEWITWYPLSWMPSWTEHVDIETIRQYTGLKDKNGVEIYEKDLVKQRDGWYTVVTYNRAEFVLMSPHSTQRWDDLNIQFDVCEVIGNIYDNPDLLGSRQ